MPVKNPYLDRLSSRDSGHHGRVAEKKAAKRMGGTQKPGSGSLPGAKGDIDLPEFLVENKATLAKSYSLKLDTLLKVYQEALEVGKSPALTPRCWS